MCVFPDPVKAERYEDGVLLARERMQRMQDERATEHQLKAEEVGRDMCGLCACLVVARWSDDARVMCSSHAQGVCIADVALCGCCVIVDLWLWVTCKAVLVYNDVCVCVRVCVPSAMTCV